MGDEKGLFDGINRIYRIGIGPQEDLHFRTQREDLFDPVNIVIILLDYGHAFPVVNDAAPCYQRFFPDVCCTVRAKDIPVKRACDVIRSPATGKPE